MASADETLQIVLDYVAAAQAARTSGADADFQRVRSLLTDDLVVRGAGGGHGEVWKIGFRDADAWVGRLRSGGVNWSQLQTDTVNAFASGDQAVVEQISTSPEGSKPVCFLFRVRSGKVAQISVYRNDASSEPEHTAARR